MANMGFLGALLAFGAFMFVILLAFYIYYAIALMTIAKKTKTENAWLAWIPIGNVYLMTQIAKVPSWYTLGVLLVFIPFLGGLAVAALMVYLFWKIAEIRHKPGWWGVIIGLVPVVNLVFLGMLAWGKD